MSSPARPAPHHAPAGLGSQAGQWLREMLRSDPELEGGGGSRGAERGLICLNLRVGSWEPRPGRLGLVYIVVETAGARQDSIPDPAASLYIE